MIEMDTLNDIFNDNRDKYRALMADLDGFDASRQDDVIKILLSVSQVFVDNAFGLGAVELAIKARDKLSSLESIGCDSVSDLAIIEHVPQTDPRAALGEPDSKMKTKQTTLNFEERTP
jgi:hypothetical protein